ncbi:MAG: hypothetical protein IJW63_04115 [Lachnospiraceae bacterium]|nr:hypothetical protein [Lachnospiraceae bacterium]
MNYKQCEDFLELNRYNEDLSEDTLESLRHSLYERIGARIDVGRVILCLEPIIYSAATVAYLEHTLKLAGFKTMTYCEDALGDYRNRWKIGGKTISQKSLCEIVEMIQDGCQNEQVDTKIPSRIQVEQLVAEMLFVQSDAKVMLWHGFFYQMPRIEGVERYDVPSVSLKPYKVSSKNLKKQVFDYGEEKKVSLVAPGKEALVGACQTLELLDFLREKGLKVEEKHARAAFEEVQVRNYFGRIGNKPLFVLDEAQNKQTAQRLKEDIEEYLPGKQVVLLLGATKKTDIEGLLEQLCSKASFVLTVAPPGIDRIPSYELAQQVLRHHPGVSAVDSLEEAMEIIGMVLPKDGAVLAVGCKEMLSQVMAIVNKDVF